MNLNRAYQWSTLLLALLGIVSYATAAQQSSQGAPVLLVWAIPTLCTGWYLSVARGFMLPRAAVNVLLAGALAYAGIQASISAVDVARIAELVIFLLIIKVADRRSPRDDGQIISLAVFLAIAAMLTGNSLIVGFLLLLFLPLLVMTVMLFQLQAGWLAVQRRAGQHRRWASVTSMRLGVRLRRTVAGATVAIIASGLFVFILLPRGVGENFLGGFGQVVREGSASGFTDRVELGNRGVVSESPAVVFTAEFRTPEGVNLGGPDRVHYLRGAVLDKYDNGVWVSATPTRPARANQPMPPGVADRNPDLEHRIAENTGGPLVEQVIQLPEVSARRPARLFTLWRPIQVNFSRSVGLVSNHNDGTAMTGGGRGSGPLTYIVTSAIAEPAPDTPGPRNAATFHSDTVRNIAGTILRTGGLDPDPSVRSVDDDSRAARLIQDHLRSNYAYTLSENPTTREAAIETFLTQTKSGHCEYFAAAMTALCRSVGINARMIAGYVAAEYVEGSGHYIVRQSNAHAWVEAEASPGIWRRYDPTPPSDLLRLHRPAPGFLTKLRQAFDAVEYAWNQSIVGFDESARERLWSPTGEPGRALASRLENLGERVRSGGLRLVWVVLVRGLLVFSAVCALGFALAILMRLRAEGRKRQGRRRDPVSLRFYSSLLATLARRGWAKPSWQPPLAHVSGLQDTGLAEDSSALVHLYYRARFRGDAPTREDLASARTLLNRIRRRPRPAEAVR